MFIELLMMLDSFTIEAEKKSQEDTMSIFRSDQQTKNKEKLKKKSVSPNQVKDQEIEMLDAGVSTQHTGSVGSQSSIAIRGGRTEETDVYYDGLLLNDAVSIGHAYDSSLLDQTTFERSEIKKGLDSLSSGVRSTLGSLYLFSDDDFQKDFGEVKLTLGSYHMMKASMGGGVYFPGDEDAYYKNRRLKLKLMREDVQGFSSASEKYGNQEKDGFHGDHYFLRGSTQLKDHGDVFFTSQIARNKLDLDQWGGVGGDDPNYSSENLILIHNLGGNYQIASGHFMQWQLGQVYLHRKIHDEKDPTHPQTYREGFYSSRHSQLSILDWIDVYPDQFSVAVEMHGYETKAEMKDEGESEGFLINSRLNPKTISKLGMGLWPRCKLNEKIYLRFGGRSSYENKNSSWNDHGYGIELGWVEDYANYIFSVYESYRQASLFQLYDPIFGNEKLKNQKASGGEIKTKFSLSEKVDQSFAFFMTRWNQLIDFKVERYENVSAAYSRGIESQTHWQRGLVTQDQIMLIATWMQTQDQESKKRLLKRPEEQLQLIYQAKINEPLTLTSGVKYKGSRDDIKYEGLSQERVRLNPYALWNLRCDYQVQENYHLTLAGDNLLDEQYEEAYGFATPRRNLSAEVQILF